MKTHDIIIAGAGCAGLSLLVRMIGSRHFSGKKILIVDREAKSTNDRTWCFWEAKAGLFEPIVYRSWDRLNFHGRKYSSLLDIAPYRYKMIRGVDFYRYCRDVIQDQPNIEFIRGEIESLSDAPNGVMLTANGTTYEAPLGFNSIPTPMRDIHRYFYLQQHFKGWTIRTDSDVFDPAQPTLMDFRTGQEKGTTFFYVLPFSEKEALVEYTLFSKDLLEKTAYDDALRAYITSYITTSPFQITGEEFGVIPMTNYPFKKKEGHIYNIGTAGGHTKASTGYTFQFIQKCTQQIVDSIIATGHPSVSTTGGRFSFYDTTLLSVLQSREMEGIDLFTDLFSHGDAPTVLKFLDNETSIGEDINVMRRLPKGVFGMAALRNVFKF